MTQPPADMSIQPQQEAQQPAGGSPQGAQPVQGQAPAGQQASQRSQTAQGLQQQSPGVQTGTGSLSHFVPPVDVTETPDEITVLADLPGVDEENVRVEATEDTLSIAAERLEEESDEGIEEGRTLQRERGQTAERTIKLPASINVEGAEAACEDGVCRVTLPKREEDKQHQIAFR